MRHGTMVSSRFLLFVAALTLSLFGEPLRAATRTVCWQLKTVDTVRAECPKASENQPGVSRPCRGVADALGFRVSLYDKDGTAATDDYIGTWTHSFTGWNCATFEWENSSVSAGEADPDVYVVIHPEVTRSDRDGSQKRIVADGYPSITSRNGSASDPNLFVASNCKSGTTCKIYPSGSLYVMSDNSTLTSQAYLALDSAQRFIQVYYDVMDTAPVFIDYPVEYDEETGSCNAGAALNRYRICLPGDSQGTFLHNGAINGRLLGHELGHALHMQLFEQDSLYTDYTLSGEGWGPVTVEHQRAATAEGWAVYTAAVQWWDPGNSLSNPFSFGYLLEEARPFDTSSCSSATNAGLALQVAKAFWDLDDANNEAAVAPAAYADTMTVSSQVLAQKWDLFPDGTDNRQDREMTKVGLLWFADPDGVNMVDYGYVAGISHQQVRGHNCLYGQTGE